MSRRGRGGDSGGRRSDSRRDQPSPSFQRGGGGGVGSGAGRGRGSDGSGNRGRGRGRGHVAGDISGYASASAPAIPPPAVAPQQPLSVAAPQAASTSASASAAGMTGEFEKLSLSPAQLPPASSKAIRFPARPGYGVAGRKCVVRANHFLVAVGERELHHYDVTITPEVTSKKVNRDVINKLVRQFGESHLGKRLPAYDGRKSLYTAGSLPFTGKEFVVNLEENDNRDRSSGPRREREFKIAIKLASKPDLHHLQQFLRSRQMDAPQETIQVLDIVLRASPSEKYVAVGRSFFHPDLGGRGPLGDGIEYWRGYYQSLRATQMGLSLNIDVSARSFYEPILVTDFIAKHLKTNLSRPLSDQDRVKVRKALKGVKVQVSHGNYTRSYKVTGVSNQSVSQLMFTLEDNVTQTSVAQYFRDKYSVVLRYTSLPALQAGREAKPIYLPMELCKIAEEQRYSKRLNEGQVAALLKATCERPHKRESNIKQMVNLIDFNGDTFVKDEFGIQVNEELTLVDARVLPSPTLNYHESGQESRVDPRFGAWNMINKKLVNGGRVDFWTCLNFARVRQDFPTEFCRQLIEMCTSKGMVFNPTPIIPINSAHPGQVEKTLFDVHKHSTEKLASLGLKDKHLQLLLIILPDASGQYGKIKRVCETEIGIVSQCCHPSKATKLSKQYFENVALKINVKVGGRNTVLKDAIQRKIPLVSDRPTIIFGADVTHPQPGEDSSPSIAAVVASIDWPEVTKYRGLVSAQPHRQEIIEDLYNLNEDPQRGRVHGGMIRELLRSFYKSTGQKPDRIIFYRDGVSEGQFSQVLLYEMDAIRKACASLQEGYQPRVTFVVVQKRHHTRLFPADHNKRDQMDKSGNILPGTVVDTKICHPTEFDFYLNSHAGIQGTSRPAHYHVLFDENGFTADALQMLTNNLCYTYARCTRSVSIVPPAYYAHLAAFRARYYIEGQSSDSGSASGSRATMERGAEVPQLPAIKENVKEVMFYC